MTQMTNLLHCKSLHNNFQFQEKDVFSVHQILFIHNHF